MTEIDGIYVIFLIISTVITLYLSFYSWNKRSNPDALYFSFLMLAVFNLENQKFITGFKNCKLSN